MLFRKKSKIDSLKACVSGKQIPLSDVSDPVFAQGMMGEGVVIIPSNSTIVAPEDCEIIMCKDNMKHAIGLRFSNGVECLVHIGLETVTLNGKGFEVFVKEGQTVKLGDKLIDFNNDLILSSGLENCVMTIITKSENVDFDIISNNEVVAAETTMIKF